MRPTASRSWRAWLAITALLVVAGSTAAVAAPEPARLQVTGREFSLALSRATVRSGPIVVELVNLGEDDHDLALRRLVRGSTTRRIRTVAPGRLGTLETRLPPGRYALWCTIADHRSRGMQARLVVKPR